MPKIEQMLHTMHEQGISEEVIAQFVLPKTKKPKPEDILAFVRQMDELLSKEQCIAIMQEQGCCKSNKVTARFRKFGEMHAGKTVAEKIALLHELDTPHKAPCHLNPDGTLTIYWGGGPGWSCPCPTVQKLMPLIIPITYCGCCGGHVRCTYQYALGVKLRLKEIVSSMVTSDGEKPCEFIFEIS